MLEILEIMGFIIWTLGGILASIFFILLIKDNIKEKQLKKRLELERIYGRK